MSEPVLVEKVLEGMTVEEREAQCACGTVIRQQRNPKLRGPMAGWWPDKCGNCVATERQGQEQERETNLRAARLHDLGVPPRYTLARLDTFSPHGDDANKARITRLANVARRFVSEWPKPANDLLVFRGGPGTGKGHLAWAIARALTLEYSASIRFAKLPSVIRDLRESWRGQGATEEHRLRAYREPDLLIVDEVSRHAFYGEPTQHLYDVLDDRMDWCRPTILTTNESEDGLAALLGPALLDRVVGYGGLVDFGDTSFRQRRAGKTP